MDFFVHRNEKCGHRREVTVSGSLTVDEKATNDGLNTDRDMAYSSKCKMTIFKIQTRDICTPPPPPPLPQEDLFTGICFSSFLSQIATHASVAYDKYVRTVP